MKSLFTFVCTVCFACGLIVNTALAQGNDSDEDNFQTVTTFGLTTNTNAAILGGFAFRQSKRLVARSLAKPPTAT
jgi:hypothetical protein